MGILLDPISVMMLIVVSTVSFMVHIYSLGYMKGQKGFERFFSFLSLFTFSMLGLVVATNIFQMYIFWELVGLASYLLIGYYYEKWSASQAGKKAFVMTRLGDIGFFLGLVALLLGYGNLGILDMNQAAQAHQIPQYLITISALLIFCGVMEFPPAMHFSAQS